MRRTLTLVVAALGALAAAAMDLLAAPPATQDPSEIATPLLKSNAGKLLTSNARLALEVAAVSVVHHHAGTWSAWHRLSGIFDDEPGAVSWGARRIDVFFRGTNNHMWPRWWTL